MAPKLKPEEIVTLLVLKQRGQSNVQIAQTLGISEGAVRYHARTAGKPDGRRNKPRKADPLAGAIAHWIASSQPDAGDPPRPGNVHALHDWLRQEHGYPGSYRSVLRFVRAHYRRPGYPSAGLLADDANNPAQVPRRGPAQKGRSPPGRPHAPPRRRSPRASPASLSGAAASSSPRCVAYHGPAPRTPPAGR